MCRLVRVRETNRITSCIQLCWFLDHYYMINLNSFEKAGKTEKLEELEQNKSKDKVHNRAKCPGNVDSPDILKIITVHIVLYQFTDLISF